MGVGDGVVHDDREAVAPAQRGEGGEVGRLQERVGGELCGVVLLWRGGWGR